MVETVTGRSDKGYTNGQYMGFFMAAFMPIGIVLWLLLDNPGMIGVGVAIGVSIGASFNQKRNPAPPSSRSFNAAVFGIAFAIILLGAIFLLLLI